MKTRIYNVGWVGFLFFVGGMSQGCASSGIESGGSAWQELEERGNRPVELRRGGATERTLIRNGEIRTANGQVYSPGYVLFGERIEALGSGEFPDLLPNVKVVDAGGAVVTPGLIDTHSHLGVYARPSAVSHRDGNEATAPTTPGVWAEHSVWPQDPGFELALEGGVTTLHILPGSANLIGGRGVTLHLVPQLGPRAMRLPGAPTTLKMACGENPKRVYGGKGGSPSTRMGNVRGQRQAFADALKYKSDREKKDPSKMSRDLNMETLVGVLNGEILPQVHCYRADDMLSMLQIADEFGFQIRSFHHALEAYKIAGVLAEKSVAVSTWADWWGFKMEANDAIMANAAMVHDAGGRAVIHSDSSVGIQRLNQEAGKALREGRRAGIDVDEEDALQWITLNPAWALGIEDQVGTLEKGKRADVVVWSGSPFSVYGEPKKVFIDGVLRYTEGESREPWSDFSTGLEVQP